VRIAGNVFEQNWADAQNGFAILFTVRNQDGRAPWSVVEDVTFESNLVRRSAAGINILGTDDNAPSGRTARLAIRNNLFEDVGDRAGARAAGSSRSCRHPPTSRSSTTRAIHTGAILTFEGPASPGFVFRDNIVLHNGSGLVGTAVAPGSRCARLLPGRPVPAQRDRRRQPGLVSRGQPLPELLEAVGFADPQNGDYRLKAGSAFRRAGSDGRDVGVDVDALERALGGIDEPALSQTSASRTAAALFCGSLLLLGYVNVGYPLLLQAWAALFPRPFRSGRAQPSVTVLIAAHNEADAIAARLNNLLSLDYPPSQLEVVVGLDGCDDASAERAARLRGGGVRIVEFEERRGKPRC
jgi:hypothetical protein